MTELEREWQFDASSRASALRGAFGFLFVTSLLLLPISVLQLGIIVPLPDALQMLPCVFACCVMPAGVMLSFITLLFAYVLCFQSLGKFGSGTETHVSAACAATSVAMFVWHLLQLDFSLLNIDPAPPIRNTFPAIGGITLGTIALLLLAAFVYRQALTFGVQQLSHVWLAAVLASGLNLLVWATLVFSDQRAPRPAAEEAIANMANTGTQWVALLLPLLSAVFFYRAWRQVAEAVKLQALPISWLDPTSPSSGPSDQFKASQDRDMK